MQLVRILALLTALCLGLLGSAMVADGTPSDPIGLFETPSDTLR